MRHPCATIHSWLTNALEFPRDCDPLREWRTGACRKTGPGEFWGFEDWKLVTGLFLDLAERHPERFRLLRYETLVQNAPGVVRGLFERLDLGWPKQTERFVRESQQRHHPHARAVFKDPAVAQRWEGELSPDIAGTILGELRGTRLEQFTLPEAL